MSVHCRPSRFAIVSLFLLLVFGVGLNLLIAHRSPLDDPRGWQPFRSHYTEEPELSPEYNWPEIPDDVAKRIGEPRGWGYLNFGYRRTFTSILDDSLSIFYEESRIGFPLTVRTIKSVEKILPQPSRMLWPVEEVTDLKHPKYDITYHPHGLILNPIVYALPLWAMLMGIRWAFTTHRRCKLARVGLCPTCGYSIDGLEICPECGSTTAPAAA